jgi:hypothetical protein
MAARANGRVWCQSAVGDTDREWWLATQPGGLALLPRRSVEGHHLPAALAAIRGDWLSIFLVREGRLSIVEPPSLTGAIAWALSVGHDERLCSSLYSDRYDLNPEGTGWSWLMSREQTRSRR